MLPIRTMCRARWRCQNLSPDDGKRNLVQVIVRTVAASVTLNDWKIYGMIRNYRKEVLGIEPAIPKICQA